MFVKQKKKKRSTNHYLRVVQSKAVNEVDAGKEGWTCASQRALTALRKRAKSNPCPRKLQHQREKGKPQNPGILVQIKGGKIRADAHTLTERDRERETEREREREIELWFNASGNAHTHTHTHTHTFVEPEKITKTCISCTVYTYRAIVHKKRIPNRYHRESHRSVVKVCPQLE